MNFYLKTVINVLQDDKMHEVMENRGGHNRTIKIKALYEFEG